MERREFLLNMTFLYFSCLLPFDAYKKRVYLTIDDCPRKNMADIIKILGENKATFFCVGEYIKQRTQVVFEAIENGHQIGNHSYTHPSFSKLNLDKAKEEIDKTGSLIDSIYREVGVKNPRLFRFPYGDEGNQRTRELLNEFLFSEGYKSFRWDLDVEDYRFYSTHSPTHNEVD